MPAGGIPLVYIQSRKTLFGYKRDLELEWDIYDELVQADNPKFHHPRRMPHEMATRIVHNIHRIYNILFGIIMLTAMKSRLSLEEDDIAIFSCQGPRTGASAENVSRPIAGLQRGQFIVTESGVCRINSKNAITIDF